MEINEYYGVSFTISPVLVRAGICSFGTGNIGTVIFIYVTTKTVILVELVFVRIYSNCWSIECFFKASKSFLKLGSKFQSHNYGAMVSHTTIVFTRYIILECIRRNHNDQKTYGELFLHVL